MYRHRSFASFLCGLIFFFLTEPLSKSHRSQIFSPRLPASSWAGTRWARTFRSFRSFPLSTSYAAAHRQIESGQCTLADSFMVICRAFDGRERVVALCLAIRQSTLGHPARRRQHDFAGMPSSLGTTSPVLSGACQDCIFLPVTQSEVLKSCSLATFHRGFDPL